MFQPCTWSTLHFITFSNLFQTTTEFALLLISYFYISLTTTFRTGFLLNLRYNFFLFKPASTNNSFDRTTYPMHLLIWLHISIDGTTRVEERFMSHSYFVVAPCHSIYLCIFESRQQSLGHSASSQRSIGVIHKTHTKQGSNEST